MAAHRVTRSAQLAVLRCGARSSSSAIPKPAAAAATAHPLQGRARGGQGAAPTLTKQVRRLEPETRSCCAHPMRLVLVPPLRPVVVQAQGPPAAASALAPSLAGTGPSAGEGAGAAASGSGAAAAAGAGEGAAAPSASAGLACWAGLAMPPRVTKGLGSCCARILPCATDSAAAKLHSSRAAHQARPMMAGCERGMWGPGESKDRAKVSSLAQRV
jgi:hypothetical protein